jgi:hypothetical protein
MKRMQDSNKHKQDQNTSASTESTPQKVDDTTQNTTEKTATTSTVTSPDTSPKEAETGVETSPTQTEKTDSEKNTTPDTTTGKPNADTIEPALDSDTKTDSTKQAPVTDAAPATSTMVDSGVTEGSNRPLLAFIAGIIVAVAGWYAYSAITNPTDVAPNRDYANPIATVNGEPVDQELFYQNLDQTLATLEAQGLDINDPAVRESYEIQVLDTIVNTQLLVSTAESAGYEPTDEEIQERIAQLETQFGDAAGLDDQLNQLGLDRDSLYEDVREQLSVDALLQAEALGDNLTVTDQELEDAYNALLEAGRELPELDTIRDALTAQIEQQKQQQLVGTYIDNLRAEAEIETNL